MLRFKAATVHRVMNYELTFQDKSQLKRVQLPISKRNGRCRDDKNKTTMMNCTTNLEELIG